MFRLFFLMTLAIFLAASFGTSQNNSSNQVTLLFPRISIGKGTVQVRFSYLSRLRTTLFLCVFRFFHIHNPFNILVAN